MPNHHGLFKQGPNSHPVFLLGIRRVFDAVSIGPFRLDSAAFHKNGKQRYSAIHIETHFRSVCERLLHSLDLFQRHFAAFGRFLNDATRNPLIGENLAREAGIAAGSIFAYLSNFIDDIARIVPFVVLNGPTENNYGSMFTKLKSTIKADTSAIHSGLKHLFVRLDDQHSWWQSGFGKGTGIRHRLVHYPDIINFQGQERESDQQFRPQAFLFRLDGSNSAIDFESELGKLLRSLCEWLDQLEEVLVKRLIDRATGKKLDWRPDPACPQIWVPVDRSAEREIPETNFLYLPICTGSAPLKGKLRWVAG